MLRDGGNSGSWFLQNVIKSLPDSTVVAGRAAHAGQILNEILDARPTSFGVGHGVNNILTWQQLNYLETLASGRPCPKNGPKRL
jgi:hypothetical protein